MVRSSEQIPTVSRQGEREGGRGSSGMTKGAPAMRDAPGPGKAEIGTASSVSQTVWTLGMRWSYFTMGENY